MQAITNKLFYHINIILTLSSLIIKEGISLNILILDIRCYGSLLGNRLVNLGISKQQHLYLKTKNLI